MTTNDQTKTTLEQAFETIRDQIQDALTELHRIIPGALEEYTPTDRWAKLPEDADMQQLAEYGAAVSAWSGKHADMLKGLYVMGQAQQDLMDRSHKLRFALSEKFEKLVLNN